ncbi:MAG: phosphoenolpyruvate synthase [Bacteroidia bacterium]
MKNILFFKDISINDIAKVGGKNASLGEMFCELNPKGINIPNGFAIVANSYRQFIEHNNLKYQLENLIKQVDTHSYSNLATIGETARKLILNGKIPQEIINDIKEAYKQLSESANIKNLSVAVRSSATAEDLPTASFAGRMESYLNISCETQLLEAVQLCYASLFTDRAIKYRFDMGFVDMDIAISVGVQQMVRSDLASSGVAFTIDPDSGFSHAIIINGIWGLGENIVQGRVTPDEWMVFKPSLEKNCNLPIIKKHCGAKEYTLVYAQNNNQAADKTIVNFETEEAKRNIYCLEQNEVIQLAQWCHKIEKHYVKSMDIEWAKDGINNQLYIVQARPETVHKAQKNIVKEIYTLKTKSKIVASGIALGERIAKGKARVLNSPSEGHLLQDGEILVTDITNPDWDTILKRAGAIVTNKGGRTSHAAIVARELGTVAIVGSNNATQVIKTGDEITVCCAEGKEGIVYEGLLDWVVTTRDLSNIKLPKTDPMFILADPDKAFELSQYPNKGVGLMRLEFAISNSVKIHPLALCRPNQITDNKILNEIEEITRGYKNGKEYFIDTLAQAVATVAAAFYPNQVIVRMSDFKSNEYANLLGGSFFEPKEENPMIGLRGASRYYSDFYREGFALECLAMKKVRDDIGLTNVKLMIPFCRTPQEGKKVLAEMEKNGLKRGENGLEIYVMVEIPSNVLLADEFAKIFDGFSIGSNDLTQLTLGLDRDSSLISYLFNEDNDAVKYLIKQTIEAAKRNNIHVGLCGQAASDLPEIAMFLVQNGINSISFNPDALLRGIENILAAENTLQIHNTELS